VQEHSWKEMQSLKNTIRMKAFQLRKNQKVKVFVQSPAIEERVIILLLILEKLKSKRISSVSLVNKDS